MSTEFRIDKEFNALIPPLAAGERSRLEENLIAANGARDPLVVWDGVLLDGHNRYDICNRLGLPFKTTTLKEKIETRDDAKLWIILNQLGRRNLPPIDRIGLAAAGEAIVAARAKARMLAGKKDPRTTLSEGKKGVDQTRAVSAKAARVSEGTYAKGKKILADAPEEIKTAVRASELSIDAGFKATKALEKMEPAMREQVLAKLDEGCNIPAAIKEITEATFAAARAHVVPLPDGVFSVIEADPPWALDSPQEKSGSAKYGVTDTAWIAGMGARLLTHVAEDCFLFLWAINPMMPEAFEVMKAWGFEYKGILTWVKPSIGTGFYYRNSTEHVLLGLRGKPAFLAADQPSHFLAPRTGKHSEKPDVFYEIVERLTSGPRMRLFARSQREGWTSWGNEIP